MFELSRPKHFANGERSSRMSAHGALIASRLDRLAYGHAGDTEPVGKGISELRIHFGPGYRIYFQRWGKTVIVLLCGGDKSTQAKDIKTAKRLADERSE
jgi:putative addiction module killer protein